MNRRSFLSLAPLILVPEPRRVYSFLWANPFAESDYERAMRLTREALVEHFRKFIASDSIGQDALDDRVRRELPRPLSSARVEVLNPGTVWRDRTLKMRVTVQPFSWEHAAQLLSQGFELA